ncbi:Dynein light chain 1, axonemal [Atta colombica]|uniref:Dynein axonemal light chain 1 n=1 Tax=Atta colombica TaxID=520822 RepID=A0A195B6J8_9HYME|nr:Dynein light chain 1, axonemal [Atta colombica]
MTGVDSRRVTKGETEGAKATTCREAIQRWEEKTGLVASEQKDIILSFQWPPIERMDNSLAVLSNVEKLSLSTNVIEKISGINSLKYLKILSLSRNNIKTFSGLEAVGDHLEELWISYNLIEKIKGVNAFKVLKVLYMGNNLVKDWAEFNRLQEIPNLQDLKFINNPICENMDAESWRAQVIRRLPALKKLDAVPIVYAMRFLQWIFNICNYAALYELCKKIF